MLANSPPKFRTGIDAAITTFLIFVRRTIYELYFLGFENEVTNRETFNLQGSSRTPLDPSRLHLQYQNVASRAEGNYGVQNQDLR